MAAGGMGVMGDWCKLLERELQRRFGDDLAGIAEKCAWVPELAGRAALLLDPPRLRAMPAQEVYSALAALGVPECPIRIAHIGRVNDAERIVEALLRLLETPGDFEEKYRAAKFPQAGSVTLTELLCVARPLRFVCRNTAFTRELAKIVPLYSARALQELPYTEFLDICRELCLIMARYPATAAPLVERYRYLLLYAAVTAK